MRKIVIGVSSELAMTAEVQSLSSRTCIVKIIEPECDILLSDMCWYMPVSHVRYLPIAIKATRKLIKESK